MYAINKHNYIQKAYSSQLMRYNTKSKIIIIMHLCQTISPPL